MDRLWLEIGRTVRAAIKSWPSTFRLILLMVVAATIGMLLLRVGNRQYSTITYVNGQQA